MVDGDLVASEFEWLANVYNLNAAINHPSELHGILIGHLSGKNKLQDDEWLALCLEHMGLEEFNAEKQPNVHKDLCQFYHDTLDAISADSSAFQLCLPDDDYALSERGEALGLWVAGFLEGLAVSQAKRLTALDEELQEILRDLVEISHLDSRLDSSETSERDFFEVCEYVRIGALNLYVEFNEPEEQEADDQPSSANPTLH